MSEDLELRAKELRRLHETEFGSRFEFTARAIGLLIATSLAVYFTGEYIPIIWACAYLLGNIAFYYLSSYLMKTNPKNGILFYTLAYLGSLLLFASIPLYLIAHEEVGLRVLSTAGLVTMLIFLTRRNDTNLMIIYPELVAIYCFSGIAAVQYASFVTGWFATEAVILSAIGLSFYFTQSVLTARKLKLAEYALIDRAHDAQKMAAIGQLSGGVAHDFNNVLAVISGNLELYEMVDDKEERHLLLQEAKQATAQGASTVAQLLMYSRAERSLGETQPLAPLLSEIGQLVNRLTPSTISTEITVTPDDLLLYVDKSDLNNAIMNMVTNAIHAMPDGGNLRLEATKIQNNRPIDLINGGTLNTGTYTMISLSDTGTGIPPSLLKRITEPFFTTKPEGKGTGLGMAAVVGLTSNFGTGLSIQSSPKGTTVQIFFPFIAP